MNLSLLTGEEKRFLGRLEDWFSSRREAVFSPFLTERQIAIAQSYAAQVRREGFALDGGYPDARRKVLGVFHPGGRGPEDVPFPITAVTAVFRETDTLSHRDFLGACMALQIARESIGDIAVEPGRAVLFVLDSVAAVVLEELHKAGSVGVRCAPGLPEGFVRRDSFEAFRGTVKSPRMDALVSLLTGLSRERGAALIQGEKARRGDVLVERGGDLFAAGDEISIQGYGRFIVDSIGEPTRKGRLPVEYRKYR